MFKIVFRLLITLVLVAYVFIKILSVISGKDILKVYWKEILGVTSLSCLLIVLFYLTFALLGIS